MAEWGKTNAPAIHGVNETARFVDYWRAQPGQRGVKTDWPATWRNWMRKAQDDVRPANGTRTALPVATLPPSTAPDVIPPEERCPIHRGRRKGSCGLCRANELGVNE